MSRRDFSSLAERKNAFFARNGKFRFLRLIRYPGSVIVAHVGQEKAVSGSGGRSTAAVTMAQDSLDRFAR
jgi:hypothetical protein